MSALESFFEEHASNLATSFVTVEKELLSLLDEMSSDESAQSSMSPERLLMITTVNRLIDDRSRSGGLKTIEGYFDSWKQKKEAWARQEFEEMCGESSFVDFWCRMKNIAKENEVGDKTIGEDGQDEDEEVVDLRAMAESIDLSEIETVLKKDKRWIAWDHQPDKRELWIRVRIPCLFAYICFSGRCCLMNKNSDASLHQNRSTWTIWRPPSSQYIRNHSTRSLTSMGKFIQEIHQFSTLGSLLRHEKC